MISQWNSNEFCHFWNQLQNNFQHELSTKKRSLDKNFLAILRTFDDTIKSTLSLLKKKKKLQQQRDHNSHEIRFKVYQPSILLLLSRFSLVLVARVLESAGRGRLEKRREESVDFPVDKNCNRLALDRPFHIGTPPADLFPLPVGGAHARPTIMLFLSCIKENSRAPASRNLFAIGSRDARPKPCARSSRARIHPPFSTTPQTWDPISFVVEPSWQHEVYIGKWIICCPVLKFIFVGRWARRL